MCLGILDVEMIWNLQIHLAFLRSSLRLWKMLVLGYPLEACSKNTLLMKRLLQITFPRLSIDNNHICCWLSCSQAS